MRLVCGLIDHERFFDAPKDLCRELGTLAQILVQRKKKKRERKEVHVDVKKYRQN